MHESYERLVEAEANGWVTGCVYVPKDDGPARPYIIGPFPSQKDARRARARLRRRVLRDLAEQGGAVDATCAHFFTRPLWKEE